MAPAERRRRIAYALLWITPLLWSSNYLIARAANGVIAPHVLALGRWVLAFAVLLPFAWRGFARAGVPWREEGPHWLVLGACGMWICGAFVYLAGQTTSAVNIGLIYSVSPILIAVASARLLNERMTRLQLVGVGFALLGVVFVVLRGDLDNLRAVRFSAGDGWIAVASLSWAAYSVLQRHWPSRLGALQRLCAISAGGIVVLIPFTLIEGWFAPRFPITWQAVSLVLLAAALPSLFSYIAYAYMQRELGASKAALVLYLGPVYAAFTAWLVLGERPAWYHGVGAALILPSIWLATRGR